MQELTFPASLYGHGNFSRRLVRLNPPNVDRDVLIDLSHVTFVRPDGIAHLISLIYTLFNRRYTVQVARPRDDSADLYLRRSNCWGALRDNGVSIPEGWEGFNYGNAPRLIECQRIPTAADDKYNNVEANAMLAERMRQMYLQTGLSTPLYHLFVELGGNAAEHSESEHGAFIMAQSYPSKNEIHIAVVDIGIGIRAALFEGHGFETDREAVRSAVLFGISGRVDASGKPNSGGTGLATARQEAHQLTVRSGTAVLESALLRTSDGMVPARKDKMLVMNEADCPALDGTIVSAIIRPKP